MSRGTVATAVLAGAGAGAVLAALLLPWFSFLVLFGALDRIEGPLGLSLRWLDRLQDVAVACSVDPPDAVTFGAARLATGAYATTAALAVAAGAAAARWRSA